MLNKVKGNMYDFVTHTWNAIKGECPHGCHYMKRFGKQKEVRFCDGELKTDLGTGNFIFVGSSCDMWADSIPDNWIEWTTTHCWAFDNRYLFQSKNPKRILKSLMKLPQNSVIGTTIESNIRHDAMGLSPDPNERAYAMIGLKERGFKTMLTIEPIMRFDLLSMVGMVSAIKPDWVNIGANTNHKVKLDEPYRSDVLDLISYLNEITEVKIKPNLKRITG